jgi:hypothetical protein
MLVKFRITFFKIFKKMSLNQKFNFISLISMSLFLFSSSQILKSSNFVLFSANNTFNFKLTQAFMFENVFLSIQKNTNQFNLMDCLSTPYPPYMKAFSYEEIKDSSISICNLYSDFPRLASDVEISSSNRSRVYTKINASPNYKFQCNFNNFFLTIKKKI